MRKVAEYNPIPFLFIYKRESEVEVEFVGDKVLVNGMYLLQRKETVDWKEWVPHYILIGLFMLLFLSVLVRGDVISFVGGGVSFFVGLGVFMLKSVKSVVLGFLSFLVLFVLMVVLLKVEVYSLTTGFFVGLACFLFWSSIPKEGEYYEFVGRVDGGKVWRKGILVRFKE